MEFQLSLQACKCPMCSRLIKSLKPHASLLNPVEEEDRKLFASIQRYNQLFVGGVQGFVQVAYFGLTKLTEAGTTRLVGTFGYMPPEHAQYGEFQLRMGSIGINNGNGFHENGEIVKSGQRLSCWYEEKIDSDLKWSFALLSMLHSGTTKYQEIQLLETKPFGKVKSTCIQIIFAKARASNIRHQG